MKVIVYKATNIPEDTFVWVSEIFKDACREREKQGIHFSFGSFKPNDIKAYYGNGGGYLIVAQDVMRMCGALMVMSRTKGPIKYISHDYLGIADDYKGKGVASLMFSELLDLCRNESYDCIVSVTNPKALSSVKYHCKNGFRIYCLKYNGKGSSYSFIYPIKKFRFINISLFRNIIYYFLTGISYLKNRFRNV